MNRIHSNILHTVTAFFLLGLVCVIGCSNECEKLAERICDQAGVDKLACESNESSVDTDKDEASQKRCKRIRSVVASCSYLQEQARHPTDEDLVACKQNLEFIRSLERQMQ